MNRFAKMLAFALLLLWITAAFATPAENVAITYKVKGTVDYVKSGTKSPAPLTAATHLSDGDKIITGKDGYCFLIFVEDKTQLKVRENTTLTISADRTDKGLDKQVNLDIGKIWTQVTKEGSNFRIATPTSVASVKGTMWWTYVDANGHTTVVGLAGIVTLLSRLSGQSSGVGSGQTGNSDNNGVNVGQTTGSILNPDGSGSTNRIEIPFIDENGNTHTLVIEYEE